MTDSDVRRILRGLGCTEVRQRGSHLRVRCGSCFSTIPIHKGEDIPKGTLRAIERDLENCLGRGWLESNR
jgi:predicted RNA binding protein YcfA (HicA-like mRNA interferase family)